MSDSSGTTLQGGNEDGQDSTSPVIDEGIHAKVGDLELTILHIIIIIAGVIGLILIVFIMFFVVKWRKRRAKSKEHKKITKEKDQDSNKIDVENDENKNSELQQDKYSNSTLQNDTKSEPTTPFTRTQSPVESTGANSISGPTTHFHGHHRQSTVSPGPNSNRNSISGMGDILSLSSLAIPASQVPANSLSAAIPGSLPNPSILANLANTGSTVNQPSPPSHQGDQTGSNYSQPPPKNNRNSMWIQGNPPVQPPTQFSGPPKIQDPRSSMMSQGSVAPSGPVQFGYYPPSNAPNARASVAFPATVPVQGQVFPQNMQNSIHNSLLVDPNSSINTMHSLSYDYPVPINRLPVAQSTSNQTLAGAPGISYSQLVSATMDPKMAFDNPYVVLYTYTRSQHDELALSIHDMLTIHRVFDDGWAYGKNERTGELGVFPRVTVKSLREVEREKGLRNMQSMTSLGSNNSRGSRSSMHATMQNILPPVIQQQQQVQRPHGHSRTASGAQILPVRTASPMNSMDVQQGQGQRSRTRSFPHQANQGWLPGSQQALGQTLSSQGQSLAVSQAPRTRNEPTFALSPQGLPVVNPTVRRAASRTEPLGGTSPLRVPVGVSEKLAPLGR